MKAKLYPQGVLKHKQSSKRKTCVNQHDQVPGSGNKTTDWICISISNCCLKLTQLKVIKTVKLIRLDVGFLFWLFLKNNNNSNTKMSNSQKWDLIRTTDGFRFKSLGEIRSEAKSSLPVLHKSTELPPSLQSFFWRVLRLHVAEVLIQVILHSWCCRCPRPTPSINTSQPNFLVNKT